jgi:beta-galactosidase
MYLGVDYYPEQWPDELLERDLDRIVELGCNARGRI